jgi:hypothetical protein
MFRRGSPQTRPGRLAPRRHKRDGWHPILVARQTTQCHSVLKCQPAYALSNAAPFWSNTWWW